MGMDIMYMLETEPAGMYDDIIKEIEEIGELVPEEKGIWSEWTRWSNMTNDMLDISKKFPFTRISMQCENEDKDQWIEHFLNGRWYDEWRPDWEPSPFNKSKLK